MTDELPRGWAWSSLGEVCFHPQYGWTTSAARIGDLRLLRTTDITSGSINWESVPFCAELPPNPAKYLLADGDIVVSRAGSVGKSYLIREPERAAFASYLIRLRPKIDTEFVAYFLKSGAYWKQISEQTAGIAIPNINGSKLRDLAIPVAPSSEQRRVVSKIDELFSRIDEGERALERVQKLVERYRQSVLKAAVTGELTRDWREKQAKSGASIETGEALLARILTARREAWEQAELDKMKAKGIRPRDDKWKLKYKEASPPDTSNLPDLPKGWVWVAVEQVCFVDTGATPKRGTEKYFKGGTFDWITSTAVNDSVILSAAEQITATALQETNAKVFPAGSLIVAMYGEGKTRGKVSELGIPAATNQACAALICGHLDTAIKNYLKTFFLKNYMALRSEAAGGVQPNLNLAIIKQTAFPLPSLSEAIQINEMVATRLSQIGAFVADFGTWEKHSAALRQKILAHAFEGVLVAQSPTDESASILLERIAIERATTLAKPSRSSKNKKKASK